MNDAADSSSCHPIREARENTIRDHRRQLGEGHTSHTDTGTTMTRSKSATRNIPTIVCNPTGSWLGSHTPGDQLYLELDDDDTDTYHLGATTSEEIPPNAVAIITETHHLELHAEDADNLRRWIERVLTDEPDILSDPDSARRGFILSEITDFGIPATWTADDWLMDGSVDDLIDDAQIPPTWEDDGWSTNDLAEKITEHCMDAAHTNDIRIAGGADDLREYLIERIERIERVARHQT